LSQVKLRERGKGRGGRVLPMGEKVIPLKKLEEEAGGLGLNKNRAEIASHWSETYRVNKQTRAHARRRNKNNTDRPNRGSRGSR